jgi:hypothetical protein
LLLAGLLVGYVVGPPLAQAATSLVRIQSFRGKNTAAVSKNHRLAVGTDVTKNSIFAITEPGGETVVLSDTGNAAKSTGLLSSADIVGISVDVSVSGTNPVTVTLRKGNVQSAGMIIWQGTLPSLQVGHIDATFGTQSILFLPGATSGFNVTVTNTGGASVQYEVYGFGFGVACCTPVKGDWMAAVRR